MATPWRETIARKKISDDVPLTGLSSNASSILAEKTILPFPSTPLIVECWHDKEREREGGFFSMCHVPSQWSLSTSCFILLSRKALSSFFPLQCRGSYLIPFRHQFPQARLISTSLTSPNTLVGTVTFKFSKTSLRPRNFSFLLLILRVNVVLVFSLVMTSSLLTRFCLC